MNRRENYFEKLEEEENNLNNYEGYFDSSQPDNNETESFVSSVSESHFKIATNFTRDQFFNLYTHFDLEMASLENTRGPRSRLTGEEKFFLLLTYCKSYDSYTSLARVFNLSPATLQRIIEKMISCLAPKFKQIFILTIQKEEQIIQNIGFQEYPNVALVLDCTIQPVPKFAGGHREVKVFYSLKHRCYCVKKEFGHLPNGKACFVSKYYPGSKHDFSIFLENVPTYQQFLTKIGRAHV